VNAGTRAWSLNRTIGLLLFGVLLVVAGTASARGLKEKDVVEAPDWETVQVNDEITVSGTIGVYGNEPHTYLAIAVVDENLQSGRRLIEITGDLSRDLRDLQNREVTVTGVVTRLEGGPGMPMAINATEYEVEE